MVDEIGFEKSPSRESGDFLDLRYPYIDEPRCNTGALVPGGRDYFGA